MTKDVFVGVVVAKGWLDIHHPQTGACRIDNASSIRDGMYKRKCVDRFRSE